MKWYGAAEQLTLPRCLPAYKTPAAFPVEVCLISSPSPQLGVYCYTLIWKLANDIWCDRLLMEDYNPVDQSEPCIGKGLLRILKV